jgi:hypothetical protein
MHVKISQLVNKMCSQQACSKLDPTEKHFGDVGILDKYKYNNNNNKACQQVVTMLLFYQVATRLSLTTC